MGENQNTGITRRGLITGGLGAAAAAAVVGAGGVLSGCTTGSADGSTVDLTSSIPFYDQKHPAGIHTPHHQRHVTFLTFDMAEGTTKDDLKQLLATWSAAAATMMQGKTLGKIEGNHGHGMTKENGEALDLGPSSLSITFGFGPSLFDERFGLEEFKPKQLEPLPRIVSDPVDIKNVDADFSIQICADDKQVIFHALRHLARLARPTANIRFSQSGFMPTTATTEKNPPAPRNLFGFKDGTRNVSSDEDFEEFVWLNNADQAWMEGGTYQVFRRMYMDIETWDADDIADQQTIFGRFKESGAPLTGTHEYDDPDYDAVDENGEKVIAWNSHGALLSYENNGFRILRRPFNYADGFTETGKHDAGFAFFFSMNDMEHWIELRQKMGKHDLMNEYVRDTHSGIWAIPKAPAKGHFIGEEFFA